MNDNTTSPSFAMEDPIPTYTEVMATLSTSNSTSLVESTPIPTYDEATSSSRTSSPQSSSLASSPSSDLPPAYTLVDTAQTTFTLNGTFLYSSSGIPVYQLSHALTDTTTISSKCLRLRRLRRKELQQHQRGDPIPFDRDSTLYEIHDPPLQDTTQLHLIGKRRACFTGVMMMKQYNPYPWGPPSRAKWRINHVLRPASKGTQILSSKPIRPTSSLANKNFAAPSPPVVSHVWSLSKSKEVAATESFRVEADGSLTPVLDLAEGLEQKWREAIISAWVARLWGVCAEGKIRGVAKSAATAAAAGWGGMLGGRVLW